MAEKDKSVESGKEEKGQEDVPNAKQLLAKIKEQRKAAEDTGVKTKDEEKVQNVPVVQNSKRQILKGILKQEKQARRRQSDCIVNRKNAVRFLFPPQRSNAIGPPTCCYVEFAATEKDITVRSVLRGEESSEDVIEVKNGNQLLVRLKQSLKEEKPFKSRRGDNLRAPFRHTQKLGRIKEDEEFRVRQDDRRYGIFQSDSEWGNSDSESDWSEGGPDVYMECDCVTPVKYYCCCQCFRRKRTAKTPPVTFKWVGDKQDKDIVEREKEDDKDIEGREKEDKDTEGREKEDMEVHDENEETEKPKRVGRMKRIRNFLRGLFCCMRKNNDD